MLDQPADFDFVQACTKFLPHIRDGPGLRKKTGGIGAIGAYQPVDHGPVQKLPAVRILIHQRIKTLGREITARQGSLLGPVLAVDIERV